MTRTKLQIQLLTILTLASTPALAETPRTLFGGRPACGNTMTKGGGSAACKRTAATERAIERTVARIGRGAVALLAAATDELAAIAPRQLPNGRPACGNTVSKGGPDPACAMRAPVPVAVRP